ncbi:uncharacterized protein BJX67DRAFT_385763 [Aspergillus lucknowensis]|uniref:Ankyrin repeat-containing domain protein n=1 Tax=Aspergillus lucknowensis TaxID=176173 RepID=A0ABR4LCL1_9EURO
MLTAGQHSVYFSFSSGPGFLILVKQPIAILDHDGTQFNERALREARAREAGSPLRDPLIRRMGSGCRYEDLPLAGPSDLSFMRDQPSFIEAPPNFGEFESGCRSGTRAQVQSVISTSPAPTPAPTPRSSTMGSVWLSERIMLMLDAIFWLPARLLSFSSSCSSPWMDAKHSAEHGAVLLPSVVENHGLFRWFLDHGANPNLRKQQEYQYGGSNPNSCAALEKAARQGKVEAVRMMLDAGAVIQNGFLLHAAAAALPPSANPHVGPVTPGRDFDISRIPVMALLVEHGADVNQKQGPQTENMVPGYAIVEAVMAGAVRQVRWVLTGAWSGSHKEGPMEKCGRVCVRNGK